MLSLVFCLFFLFCNVTATHEISKMVIVGSVRCVEVTGILAGQEVPATQVPSMGCSIKWKVS